MSRPHPAGRIVDRKSIWNLFALTAIQLSNAALPLVAFPWLLRVVGTGPYAQIVVAESIAVYVLAAVVYSFDIQGVAKIATLDLHRDIDQVSRIFSGILVARLIVLGAAGVLLLLALPFLSQTTGWLVAAWLLLPVSYALQSMWFFQGIERNGFPAAVYLISRLGCLGLLFALVRRPEDFLLAPLLIGASYLAGAIAILLFAVFGIGIRLVRVPLAEVWDLLMGGKAVFVGNVSVALYRDSNVLILGAFSSSSAVAVYSVAEKIVKALQAMSRPLNQIAYPRVVRALSGIVVADRRAFRVVMKYTAPQWAVLAVALGSAAALVVFFRGWLPAWFQSPESNAILGLVLGMSVSVFFGVANFMFGSAGLNHLGGERYLAVAILLTGVCSLVGASILATFLDATGGAIAFVLSEALLFVLVARAYGSPAAT